MEYEVNSNYATSIGNLTSMFRAAGAHTKKNKNCENFTVGFDKFVTTKFVESFSNIFPKEECSLNIN